MSVFLRDRRRGRVVSRACGVSVSLTCQDYLSRSALCRVTETQKEREGQRERHTQTECTHWYKVRVDQKEQLPRFFQPTGSQDYILK